MRNYKRVLVFIFILSLTSVCYVEAQCYSFAKNVVKSKLGDFIHDGNYNATMLGVGDVAQLEKMFFEGQKYRIVISKVAGLPPLRLKVKNRKGKILYDNAEFDYAEVWDFTSVKSDVVNIFLELEDKGDPNLKNVRGCVAILFGIENIKKKKNKKRK